MRFVGIDTEFDPASKALVCISYAERLAPANNIHTWVHPAYLDETKVYLLSLLNDPGIILVGMAWALDSVVIARWGGEEVRRAIVANMERSGIADVFIEEWLLWVAFPSFLSLWQCATPWVYVSPDSEERHQAGGDKRPMMGLAAIARRWCNINMEASKQGEDSIRLSFSRVAGLPVEAWDPRYVAYACEDARVHLLCYEAHQVGKSKNPNVANDKLGGLMRLFDKVKLARPDLANTLWRYHLPGEHKAIIDMLPMAWLCDSSNGGLYVDPEYCDNLIERYRTVALVVEPLAGDLLRNVEARAQTDMFAAMLTSVALIKQSKIVKVNKGALRRTTILLYDKMPVTWAPPATTTGQRKVGKFPRYWRDWDTSSGVGQRDWASLSCKVIAECLLAFLVDMEQTPEVLRVMSWLIPTANPGHALHAVSAGRWPAAAVLSDGVSITDPVMRKLWAYCVRDMCLRTISNTLAPLAKAGVASNAGTTPTPITPTRAKLLITGRMSLIGPIRQNANRVGGCRETLVPQAGHVVFLADYSQIELLGFAKAIEFAYMKKHKLVSYESSLTRVLRAGKDAHIVLTLDLLQHGNQALADKLRGQAAILMPGQTGVWVLHDVAAKLRKLSKAPGAVRTDIAIILGTVIDELRENAKRLNYGLGGMMQPAKFVETQRRQGDYSWTINTATTAWGIWRGRWHESAAFEELCREIVQRGGYYFHDRCWRARGGLTLTQAANTLFQTPIAEMFKVAMYRAWRETFERDSAMFGCRVVLPVHDEIVCTGPRDQAPAALKRLQAIMVQAGEEYLPDLPIGTSGAIMPRFSKAG